MNQRVHGAAWVLLLALFTGLIYQSGDAVWDDHTLIVDDLAQRPLSSVLSLWGSPVGATGPGQSYYRPVSMMLLSFLGHGGIWLIHVAVACMHAISTALLLWLLRAQKGQIFGGLVFAVHPLASEVLGWASALPDALSVMFALAAVCAIRRSIWWAIALAVGSVLSKESGLVVLVALIPAFSANRRGATCLLVAIGSMIVPRLALGLRSGFQLEGRESMVADAVAWPLTMLGWPQPLTVVHDLWLVPGWVVWAALSGVIGMLFLARRSRLGLLAVGLCVGAALMAAPPSISAFMVGERYMYPALVGLGAWTSVVVRPGVIQVGLACVLTAVSIGVHFQRAGDWVNDRFLFEAALIDAPNSSLTWHFTSVVCRVEGNWDCVARSANRSLVHGHPPNELETLATFLEALVEIGRPDVALQVAEGRPPNADQSDDLVWAWARAALAAGQPLFAQEILSQLERPEDWSPPLHLQELIQAVRRSVELKTEQGDPPTIKTE